MSFREGLNILIGALTGTKQDTIFYGVLAGLIVLGFMYLIIIFALDIRDMRRLKKYGQR